MKKFFSLESYLNNSQKNHPKKTPKIIFIFSLKLTLKLFRPILNTKFIVANAYFPNDHKQGKAFAEKMYTKVLEVQAEYPDHVTFLLVI